MVASLIPPGAREGQAIGTGSGIFEAQAIASLEAVICESANGGVDGFGGQKAVEAHRADARAEIGAGAIGKVVGMVLTTCYLGGYNTHHEERRSDPGP